MIVTAKCVIECQQSNPPWHFYPGNVVQIESSGPLAGLKKCGRWCFEFDRDAEGVKEGNGPAAVTETEAAPASHKPKPQHAAAAR